MLYGQAALEDLQCDYIPAAAETEGTQRMQTYVKTAFNWKSSESTFQCKRDTE